MESERKNVIVREHTFPRPKNKSGEHNGNGENATHSLQLFQPPSPTHSHHTITRCCTIIQIYEPWLRCTSGGLRVAGVRGAMGGGCKVASPQERAAEAVIR